MPKAFEEFSKRDMEQIRVQIETLHWEYLNKKLGSLRTVRNDKGIDYAVLEYKRQIELTFDGNDYNNPDITINIGRDFSCIVTGFDIEDEAMIKRIVFNYLKSNDFTR